MPAAKIDVAVSACLLGQAVRYDGQHKYNKTIPDNLGDIFKLVPFCPEVSCGMGVPRPKIQLLKKEQQVILTRVQNPDLDYNKKMIQCAKNFLEQFANIGGIILKDKSPSCGIGNTPIFDQAGKIIAYGNGLFAQTIKDLAPDLPIIQADALEDKINRNKFIAQVIKYISDLTVKD
jgi:uncharacterized protein YbbK (DUF523 family)